VTQAQLAAALGASIKTVQSYEQGWRHVPTRVLIQLLVLLAIYRRREVDKVPCWEIRHCPPEEREKCASYTLGDGQLCWFVTAGGGGCGSRPDGGDEGDALLPCMECEVIQRLLRTAGPAESAPPESRSGAADRGLTGGGNTGPGKPL
jgi:hypothetical protein